MVVNPYFDRRQYPWDLSEAQKLRRALTDGISLPARIDLVYKQTAADLPPLNLNQAADVIWKEALGNIAAYGLLRRFVGLEEVVGIVAAREAIEVMVAAKVTNADARVESGGVIVLDRVGLDGLIEQVAPDQTPMKVLLVRGTPRSGKSWSRHRFERAATAWGAKSVYICDGMVGSVQDMVYLLFSEVGASDRIPPMDTSPTAWYRTVCYRLREEASRLNRPLWIAVDDLGVAGDGTPLLDPEIRRFFDQLALLLLNPSFREMFRLMLIHYPDGAVPTKWPTDLWCEDRTCDTDIDKAHVAVMIRSWSDARGRTVLDDEVAELADGVITTAEADLEPGTPPTPRLRRIYDALTSLLRQLDGVLP